MKLVEKINKIIENGYEIINNDNNYYFQSLISDKNEEIRKVLWFLPKKMKTLLIQNIHTKEDIIMLKN